MQSGNKKTRLHLCGAQARQIKEVLAKDAGLMIAPGLIVKMKPRQYSVQLNWKMAPFLRRIAADARPMSGNKSVSRPPAY